MAENRKLELDDEQLDKVTGGIGIQISGGEMSMSAGSIGASPQVSSGGGIQVSGSEMRMSAGSIGGSTQVSSGGGIQVSGDSEI